MRFSTSTISLCLALYQGVIVAAEQAELTSEDDRISYSLGHQVGSDLQQQNMQLEKSMILRGIQDGLAGSEPLLSTEEMQTLLRGLKHDIVTSQEQERLNAIKERRIKREMARKEGSEFLAANAKKPGIKTLPSGLQYRVITPGKGKSPAATDTVSVYYRSTLLDGSEFGGTEDGKPESFVVADVIPGLKEALQLMQPGAKWELFIPNELGFGRRGALEDQTTIYEIELLGIEKASEGKTVDKSTQPE